MKLLGRILCALPRWVGGGHKKRRWIAEFSEGDERVLVCPRCGDRKIVKPKEPK